VQWNGFGKWNEGGLLQYGSINRCVHIATGEDEAGPFALDPVALFQEGGEGQGAGAFRDLVGVGEIVAHGIFDLILRDFDTW